eukprot:CAMPEP_0206461906 /NCGR_PEP_ID=MMETSP0324_2-20121206/25647_1 /ASSEMBLY_ACC=CAM_ASM_000836 /TAXON_ID=2866 /ORGANISM="Crypthecodinium cohnii, Strain Seligo" /LENGTH=192 /DNA_ID=CAMNT_0053933931 /DNA_START=72 /DNA_END=650 /DNA_ORIENTATION=+
MMMSKSLSIQSPCSKSRERADSSLSTVLSNSSFLTSEYGEDSVFVLRLDDFVPAAGSQKKEVLRLDTMLEPPEPYSASSPVPVSGGHESVDLPPVPSPEDCPSVGSLGHPHSCAEGCKYQQRRGTCKDGRLCVRCHLCAWKRPPRRHKRGGLAQSIASSSGSALVELARGSEEEEEDDEERLNDDEAKRSDE